MISSKWIFIGSLVVLAAGALALIEGDDESRRTTAARTPVQEARPPVISEATVSMQAPTPTPAQIVSSSKLRPIEMMSKSMDWYALMREFEKHPGEGGIYYADMLRSRCLSIRDLIKEVRGSAQDQLQGASTMRLSMLARGETLCAGFQDYELELASSSALYRLQGADDDPILKMRRRMTQDLSFEEKVDLVRSVLASQIPTALSLISLNTIQQGVVFDGVVYDTPGLYYAAVDLAACDLGDDCGQTDFNVLFYCAAMGECADSRQGLILSRYAGDESALRDLSSLKSSLVDAAKRRNPAPFLKEPAHR